jgi:MinD-like ATPase involved in chromosome partitioning or flagellar assembly
MSDGMSELIEELKKTYDYIILDTPPVGLVSDALELAQYSDVTLYIVRQNFSKKGNDYLLNNRVKRGSSTMRVLFLMVLKIRLNMALVTAMVTAMGMVLIQMDILMRRNHGISMMQSRKITTKRKKK